MMKNQAIIFFLALFILINPYGALPAGAEIPPPPRNVQIILFGIFAAEHGLDLVAEEQDGSNFCQTYENYNRERSVCAYFDLENKTIKLVKFNFKNGVSERYIEKFLSELSKFLNISSKEAEEVEIDTQQGLQSDFGIR